MPENEAQFIHGLIIQRRTERRIERVAVKLNRKNTEHVGVFRRNQMNHLFRNLQIGKIVNLRPQTVGNLFQKLLLGEEPEIHKQLLKRGPRAFVFLDDLRQLLFGADIVGDQNIFQRLIFSVEHDRSPN